ncbi:hypothetical protein COT99_00265 [Candidatus Falkowbacteria bacterium CG10_big_fil_rev_8_21_14_0_10_43_10]|uniref:Uncharacterized protein n=1 Tax=Candidatus Falkowbacteria bacterium CG10_big_fil_rev_8_21_14_0_10_43_10 TaxID=1974567 RepID=A0A2H0V517_9BACT|nr:MAG: hypothetical protein COT99_00265 [Candidatus Falkowbacteria bacterium CG10_big_fil_rev_8_21_14_0_10_43_10]
MKTQKQEEIVNNNNGAGEVKENIDEKKIIFSILDNKIELLLNEIDCNNIKSYEDIPKNEILNYCNKYFKRNFIVKDNLKLSIKESNNIKTNFGQLKLEDIYREKIDYAKMLIPDISQDEFKKIEQSSQTSINYRNNISQEYELVLSLVDDLGNFPIYKWYVTTSSYDINSDTNFSFWDICEGGCKYNPQTIINNYLIWYEPLYDIGGASSICTSVTGEHIYRDDEYIKCDIVLSIGHYIKWDFR